MATALPSFLDSMKCPICLDFAENAMETVCCAQVYCEKCVTDLKGEDCSSCREPNLETCVSRIAQRTIGELPVECTNDCGETVTRATLGKHKELCPKREYKCPIAECEFSGLLQHLADHATAKHPKDVVSSLTKAFATPPEIELKQKKVFNCPYGLCDIEMEQQELIGHLEDEHIVEQTRKIFHPKAGNIIIHNSERMKASMARNGKFYCGRLAGADIQDEDGEKVKQVACSYENEVNCRSCMKLDVSLRNLPYGWLVNGAGHVTKPSPCTHHVEDSGYFEGNFGKSALCRYTTCGNVPKFTCNMPDTAKLYNQLCSIENPCKDCGKINYVYGIHFPRDGGVKVDKDYYGYVWKKT